MSQYMVAMVTKKTQILFFTLFFQCLKWSYLLPVPDVLFKVALNEGENHWEHFDTKIDHITCFLKHVMWSILVLISHKMRNENHKHEK